EVQRQNPQTEPAAPAWLMPEIDQPEERRDDKEDEQPDLRTPPEIAFERLPARLGQKIHLRRADQEHDPGEVEGESAAGFAPVERVNGQRKENREQELNQQRSERSVGVLKGQQRRDLHTTR